MARTWIKACGAIALAILLAHDGAVAQRGQAGPVSEDLAVEIVGEETPGLQFPVLAGPDGGSMETSPTRWLAGWKKPKGVPPLTRLRLRAMMEGADVKIKVSVVFDDSHPADSPGPKYGAREQHAASYFVREGETVTVRELADFGVEPLLLRVVRAAPRPAEHPLAAPCEAVSKLKAVEVISFWLDPAEPTWYRLSLRNLTRKDITALEIYEAQDGRPSGTQIEMRAGPTRPVIAAGGVYETQINVGSNGKMTPNGFVQDPPRPVTFVVGTVVFGDGTYEGEAEVAARMEARQVGRQLQLGRAVPLLKALIDAPEQDVELAVEGLKSRISSLRIDVDVSIVNELLARYPSLSGDSLKRNLTAQVMDGLRGGREEVLHAIKQFERTRASNSEGGDFHVWLGKTKERYESMTLKH